MLSIPGKVTSEETFTTGAIDHGITVIVIMWQSSIFRIENPEHIQDNELF